MLKPDPINLLRLATIMSFLGMIFLNVAVPVKFPNLSADYQSSQLENASILGKSAFVTAFSGILDDNELVIIEASPGEFRNSYDYFWSTYWLYPAKVSFTSMSELQNTKATFILIRSSAWTSIPSTGYELIYEFGPSDQSWILLKRLSV